MTMLFHLAFPVHDIGLAKAFYHDILGCKIGRETDNALVIQLGLHQLVAHKIDDSLPEQLSIYPRHFGLIFLEKKLFDDFIQRLERHQVVFKIPLKTRFPHTKIEHQSFFLSDPSNNLLEFKYYTHDSAIFGEKTHRLIGEK